jgi:hypothetical protein
MPVAAVPVRFVVAGDGDAPVGRHLDDDPEHDVEVAVERPVAVRQHRWQVPFRVVHVRVAAEQFVDPLLLEAANAERSLRVERGTAPEVVTLPDDVRGLQQLDVLDSDGEALRGTHAA